jgi:hypothetical protein
MAEGVDSGATGDRGSLAPSRVQALLDTASAASEPFRKKVRWPGVARTHLPHGWRELRVRIAFMVS